MSNNIVRGTVLLSGAAFLSKILGMIYVIPFNEIVGEQGGALFQYAYNPYNILISLSTVGVPLAVSKFVSKYNSLGDYQTSMRMFRSGLLLMAITGILAFLTLFFSAEWIAKQIIVDDNKMGNSIEDVTMVIQMVSFALLIIPSMSIVRGFFQGHQSMGPTAVSQIAEQIVRIVFLLVAVFLIIEVVDGPMPLAVGFATFATFIGAIASSVVLWVYWRKRKPYIERSLMQQQYTHDISTKEMFIELFRYAGPFVMVGIATPLYQLVDQFTFHRGMMAIGELDISEIAFATINFYGHKLVIIPVTIATGLSLAILPALTDTFTQNRKELLFKQINQALQIISVLVIPAAVGLAALSYPAYGALYGMNHIALTGSLLAWYAPIALILALFTVTSSILQGINQQHFAVISLLAGLFVKILFNIPLIHLFSAKGAIFGTALASGTAVVLNLWRIKKSIHFSYRQTFKRTLLVLIFSAIMFIAIVATKFLFGMLLPYEESRTAAVIMLMIGVSVGGVVYLWLGYASTLLERVLGNRVRILDKVFRR
ncbi:polysaccharide biosynthesis protein [Virgibacillus sp. LDC-1]|uniref:putative polysaccharide biosynthesis protein n=1 Tax=Virgibacillus sp. LDC-1 TaxID=3039856 RepID=UPI0024DE0E22|nr:polysaccharide biosynthesis protein [Virgibacillus sp. LDC-1]